MYLDIRMFHLEKKEKQVQSLFMQGISGSTLRKKYLFSGGKNKILKV